MPKSFSPKINLIYFKNILDNVMFRFFEDHNDFFTRDGGEYVFSGGDGRRTLKGKFERYFIEELSALVETYRMDNPKYYFVIGSCFPHDNVLLKYVSGDNSIPAKVMKLIERFPDIKYFIKESGIRLDNVMFNCIFEDIFNKYHSSSKNVAKSFGNDKKLFFIKSRDLDCYSMYRIIKDMFGRTNTVNMHKVNIDRMHDVIRSVNEIIGKHVQKKKEICRSEDLEFSRKSIKFFIDRCMGVA